MDTIKFNITGVPSNATVLNAQMKLRYYGTSGSTWIDRWVQAHQVLRHWRESEADSLKRRVGSNWLSPRGKIGPGSDSTLVDANGQYESATLFKDLEYPAWKIWDLTALTQKWINSTATNYGVILWATNEDANGMNLFFRSSEYTTDPTMQPKLEIIWSQLPHTVYFLKDHLGSIRASVQDTSTAPVVGYDDYDPWGYILAGRSLVASGWSSQAGIVKNKFTGKEWDDEFGLNWNYFGARYYDPQIGRWMSVDPLAKKYPGLSPYVYALNNSLRYTDPDGRCPTCILPLVVSATKLVMQVSSFATSVAGEINQRIETKAITTNNKIEAGNISLPTPEKAVVDVAIVAGTVVEGIASSAEAHVGFGKSLGKVQIGNVGVGGNVGIEIGTGGAKAKAGGGVPGVSGGVSVSLDANLKLSGSFKIANTAKGTTSGNIGIDTPSALGFYAGGSVNIEMAKQAAQSVAKTVEQIKKTEEALKNK